MGEDFQYKWDESGGGIGRHRRESKAKDGRILPW